jgi:hypothetical protein
VTGGCLPRFRAGVSLIVSTVHRLWWTNWDKTPGYLVTTDEKCGRHAWGRWAVKGFGEFGSCHAGPVGTRSAGDDLIAVPPVPFHPCDKLPAIIRYAGYCPLAWIDDALPPEAHTWVASRRPPTLLISIEPAEGLTRPAIDQALRWARRPNGRMISDTHDR